MDSLRFVPSLSMALLFLVALSAPAQAGESATAQYVGGGVAVLGVGFGNMVPPTLDHSPGVPSSFVTIVAADDVYGQAPFTICLHEGAAVHCVGPFVGMYANIGGAVTRVEVWVHSFFVSDSLDAGLGSMGVVTATFL